MARTLPIAQSIGGVLTERPKAWGIRSRSGCIIVFLHAASAEQASKHEHLGQELIVKNAEAIGLLQCATNAAHGPLAIGRARGKVRNQCCNLVKVPGPVAPRARLLQLCLLLEPRGSEDLQHPSGREVAQLSAAALGEMVVTGEGV